MTHVRRGVDLNEVHPQVFVDHKVVPKPLKACSAPSNASDAASASARRSCCHRRRRYSRAEAVADDASYGGNDHFLPGIFAAARLSVNLLEVTLKLARRPHCNAAGATGTAAAAAPAAVVPATTMLLLPQLTGVAVALPARSPGLCLEAVRAAFVGDAGPLPARLPAPLRRRTDCPATRGGDPDGKEPCGEEEADTALAADLSGGLATGLVAGRAMDLPARRASAAIAAVPTVPAVPGGGGGGPSTITAQPNRAAMLLAMRHALLLVLGDAAAVAFVVQSTPTRAPVPTHSSTTQTPSLAVNSLSGQVLPPPAPPSPPAWLPPVTPVGVSDIGGPAAI